MTKAIDDAIDAMDDKEGKINSFSEILDGLDSTTDKKKLLWKEIYENALTDRENAYTFILRSLAAVAWERCKSCNVWDNNGKVS